MRSLPAFLAVAAAVTLTPGPAFVALAMAAVIVAFDIVWYGSVALLVDRLRAMLRQRLTRRVEQAGGAVLVAFGLRMATEAR